MSNYTPADLAIRARWILPVEPAGALLENHALVCRGGRIAAVVPAGALDQFEVGELIDRPEHVLIPGLVNAHTHAAMSLFRTAAGGRTLDDWLRAAIWPLESRVVDANFVADGTALAVAEMLLGGVTSFADMYFHPDVAASVAARTGIRGVIGLPVVEQPTAWAESLDEYLARSLELHDQYRTDPLISTCFALHSPTLTQDSTLSHVRTLADQLQCPVMIHLLESPTEREREQRRHGRGPLERLEAAGMLNDLLIAAHCIHASKAEIGRLARSGVSVVHCPTSNLKLGSGIAPLAEMLSAGLNVALGTDGAASNGSLDLLGEARFAALLAAGVSGAADILSAGTALQMATLEGARALGLAEVTGSLIPGKWADVACLRLAGPGIEPVIDMQEAIIYAAGRQAVTDVWVAGRHLVAGRRLTRIDLAALLSRADAWKSRVVAALEEIAGK